VKERFLSEMVFPGEAWVVPVARRFVGAVLLAAGYGDVDNARLVVSELISNAIQHTTSGRDDGVVAVEVVGVDGALARIEVTDDGADTVPRPYVPRDMDCGGRRLLLVDQVSAAWGVRPLGGRQRAVWAEVPTALNTSADFSMSSKTPHSPGVRRPICSPPASPRSDPGHGSRP
jgi:anti-sigma regulatory factor (Ser/Thr protein kinase)